MLGPWQANSHFHEHPGVTPVIVDSDTWQTGSGFRQFNGLRVVNSCVSSDANSNVSGSVSVNTAKANRDLCRRYRCTLGTVSGGTINGTYTASGACVRTAAHG